MQPKLNVLGIGLQIRELERFTSGMEKIILMLSVL